MRTTISRFEPFRTHSLQEQIGRSLANTVNTEAIKAEYKNGVFALTIPKREEGKPKQIKVNVEAPVAAAAAGR